MVSVGVTPATVKARRFGRDRISWYWTPNRRDGT